LVHYYTEVETSAGALVELITSVAGRASTIGTAVYRDGEALYARMSPSRATPAKKVEVELGITTRSGESLVIPVTWWATGASALFPRMDGDLTISPLGPDQSSVSFQGVYEPPLGPMGRLLDRSVLRRVADSTVKAWVDRLVTETATPVAEAPPR
jgi:hypothetical protein